MLNQEQVNKLKEELLIKLNEVKRPGIDKLINFVVNISDFCKSPASTIYHGSYEGGLLEHSFNVYNELKRLVKLYGFENEISEESIIICGLLHDLCKANTYVLGKKNIKNEATGKWESIDTYKREPLFYMGHAAKSVYLIQQYIELYPAEAQAIYAHMGGFDTSEYTNGSELSNIYRQSKLAILLNLADMASTFIIEEQNKETL